MIVPMKKVSLFIMGNKRKDTLKKLRKLGMLHIEISEGSGGRLNEIKEQIALLESSIYAVSAISKNSESPKPATTDEALFIANKIAELGNESKQLQSNKVMLDAEYEKFKDFGDFDPERLNELSAKGIKLSFYSMPMSEYQKLDESLKTVAVSKTKASVIFFAVADDDALAELKPFVLQLPKTALSVIKQEIGSINARMAEIDVELKDCACYLDSMKAGVAALNKEVEFQIYDTGMNKADLSEKQDGKVTVSYFTGYVEAENADALMAAAKQNAWGIVLSDPGEDDNVPTKLKNNKFVSLIYPITEFLGTVPGYFEYDISGWFLSFIMIFFGIIFGDGGYGLLIMAVGAVPVVKALCKKQKAPATFLLVLLLGLSTVVWGTLTCTWFGLDAAALPKWLRALSVPVISNVNADKLWYPFWTNGKAALTTSQNVQILCFTLALVQLCVAHFKGVARNRGSLKMLGDIGSVFQLLGIYYVVLSLVVNSAVFPLGLVIGGIPVGTLAICLVGVGFILSFVFSNYEGSLIKAVVASLTDIVSMLLGVVNVFSDIVSYIRLWAVGLAGSAISATVNELVSPMLGNFLFMIFAIIILVFGHGLNMILNVLSVIVHGIRLNTLEFSSHLGMSWSGHKFKPFNEQ